VLRVVPLIEPMVMKYLFFYCLAFAHGSVFAQSDSLRVNVFISNQIGGQPIDATLKWYLPGSLMHGMTGKYSVLLDSDREETLLVSKAGYFDSEIRIDYETVKQNPLIEVPLQPQVPQLHISVVDADSNKPLTSAVDLFTLDESTEIFSEEVSVAPYIIDLQYDQVQVLQVRASGYFSFKDTIDFKGVYDGRIRKKQIKLVPLKAGGKIALHNIHFEPNKADLTEFAKLMLTELTHALQQMPKMVLEISAYTDDIGSDASNLELSRKRATSVKAYLVEKGASPDQLIAKGLGKASPLVPNTNEHNRALNRKVEFKILNIRQ
jgi:outer membrane protein OmpA-like peptidoglycan-associated protein